MEDSKEKISDKYKPKKNPPCCSRARRIDRNVGSRGGNN